MNVQELVILRFRESVPNIKSFIQHLADTLDISYDAAYRRIQGKAKIDVQEAMTLAHVGQFSLDELMTAHQELTALGTATKTISSIKDLEVYFKTMEDHLKSVGKNGVEWIYSAKDIPVFHHFDDSLLGRFKVYVWMQILDENQGHVLFKDFHVPLTIKEQMKRNKALFQQFHRVEIWNDTTISSSLQQIYYYHEAGFVNTDTAIELCNDLKDMLSAVQRDLKSDHYDIYYHELLIMTNDSLVRKDGSLVAGFITMTLLGYIRFSGRNILKRIEEHFNRQIKQATSIKNASVKEQAIFFNKMYQKINALEKSLERYDTVGF